MRATLFHEHRQQRISYGISSGHASSKYVAYYPKDRCWGWIYDQLTRRSTVLWHDWCPCALVDKQHFQGSHVYRLLFSAQAAYICMLLLYMESAPSPPASCYPCKIDPSHQNRLNLEIYFGIRQNHRINTSTICLYISGRLFTSQTVRIENRLGCPRLFGPSVMY